MAIVKWDPFRDVAELQSRINRMFDDSFGPSRDRDDEMNVCAWTPAVDIYETEAGVTLAVELPGVGKENVAIEVKDNILTLKGKRLAARNQKRSLLPPGALLRYLSTLIYTAPQHSAESD